MINTESRNFIRWSIKKLEDKGFFEDLVLRIRHQEANYYKKTNKRLLLGLLQKKMEAGAEQYGEPEKELKVLYEEIHQELLDLIGWNMLILWSLEKNGVKIT